MFSLSFVPDKVTLACVPYILYNGIFSRRQIFAVLSEKLGD